jgi:hypothetical protein
MVISELDLIARQVRKAQEYFISIRQIECAIECRSIWNVGRCSSDDWVCRSGA